MIVICSLDVKHAGERKRAERGGVHSLGRCPMERLEGSGFSPGGSTLFMGVIIRRALAFSSSSSSSSRDTYKAQLVYLAGKILANYTFFPSAS